MDAMTYIDSILNPREQWAMSAADNVWGMSLPEYHPVTYGATPVPEPVFKPVVEASVVEEPSATETVSLSAPLSAEDPVVDNIPDLVQTMLPKFAKPDSIAGALDKLLGSNQELLAKAKKDMFMGAVLKTVAAADDFFTRTIGLGPAVANLNTSYDIAKSNYNNQMDAIDNQVLYIKHQLADRFNKTVQTNIMNLAAKNLRVTAGNVLDLSKEEASEITEDMRTAESNANLKKIALQAKKESAKESTRYAEKQLYTGLIGSAVKLGLMVETGGGTGESFGDLYKGYKKSKDFTKAIKGGTLTGMYD
jgi:hypothetical protein